MVGFRDIAFILENRILLVSVFLTNLGTVNSISPVPGGNMLNKKLLKKVVEEIKEWMSERISMLATE